MTLDLGHQDLDAQGQLFTEGGSFQALFMGIVMEDLSYVLLLHFWIIGRFPRTDYFTNFKNCQIVLFPLNCGEIGNYPEMKQKDIPSDSSNFYRISTTGSAYNQNFILHVKSTF